MATVYSFGVRSAAIADLYAGKSVKQVLRKYDLRPQAIGAWKRMGFYRPGYSGVVKETADKAYTNGNGNGVKGSAAAPPKYPTIMERLMALEKRMDETFLASLNARERADTIAKEIGLEA